jgi:hypothetical protein
MAFHFSPRFVHVVEAYKLQASLAGITASKISKAHSRCEPSGHWHLSDGQRIVAIVTPRKRVTLVTV